MPREKPEPTVNEHGFQRYERRDDFDPGNPFIRKVKKFPPVTRHCRVCGTRFTFHAPYDPENPSHDLCDDCLFRTAEERIVKEMEGRSLQLINSDACGDAAPRDFDGREE